MAERRMFTKKITNSDAFVDMPLSTQALYFHLNMEADDDGFNSSPKKVQRMIGASDDDLKLLFAKNFVIPFESGVVVIKHWKLHNYIQKDRYRETVYLEEKGMLETKENKTYTLMDTECVQNVYTGKDSIELGKSKSKDSIELEIYSPTEVEQPVPYSEIISYLNLKAGTAYRYQSRKTKDLIKARINEGFTLEDFKIVIDKKCVDWLRDKDMKKYLRPETLFGTKFEGYLNQPMKEITTADLDLDFSDFR